MIQVFRNLGSPYASEMDRRIVEFQITNPRTSSGKPIVVRTVEIRDYPDLLQNHLGKDINADVIILDAPADADLNSGVKADMAHSVNICSAVKACPAEVPAMVSFDRLWRPQRSGADICGRIAEKIRQGF